MSARGIWQKVPDLTRSCLCDHVQRMGIMLFAHMRRRLPSVLRIMLRQVRDELLGVAVSAGAHPDAGYNHCQRDRSENCLAVSASRAIMRVRAISRTAIWACDAMLSLSRATGDKCASPSKAKLAPNCTRSRDGCRSGRLLAEVRRAVQLRSQLLHTGLRASS